MPIMRYGRYDNDEGNRMAITDQRVSDAFQRSRELKRQEGYANRERVFDTVVLAIEPITALEVAHATGLEPSTAHSHLGALIAESMLFSRIESQSERANRGGVAEGSAFARPSTLYWAAETVPVRTRREVVPGYIWDQATRKAPKRKRRRGQGPNEVERGLLDRYVTDASYAEKIRYDIVSQLRRQDSSFTELVRSVRRSNYTVRAGLEDLIAAGEVERIGEEKRGCKFRMVVADAEPAVAAPVPARSGTAVTHLAIALANEIDALVEERTASANARADAAEAALAQIRSVIGGGA